MFIHGDGGIMMSWLHSNRIWHGLCALWWMGSVRVNSTVNNLTASFVTLSVQFVFIQEQSWVTGLEKFTADVLWRKNILLLILFVYFRFASFVISMFLKHIIFPYSLLLFIGKKSIEAFSLNHTRWGICKELSCNNFFALIFQN